MTLRYRLHPKNVKGGRTGVFVGRIRREGTLNEEAVIRYMAANHRLALIDSQALAFLHDYSAVIHELLLKGYHVNTALVNHQVSVKGEFEGPRDRFDKARHSLKIRLSLGRLLRREEKKMPAPKKY
jgi:hypothetical protein